MTLRHLRIFVTVYELGGITKAAEMLHIAQPSVSFTVSELEGYYGISLFLRTGRKLSPTESGHELYRKAKNVLSSFDEFELAAFKESKEKRIRIGASLTIGETFIPKLALLIREKFPDCDLHITVDRTESIERLVDIGEVDVGIIEGEPTLDTLRCIPAGDDRIAAFKLKKSVFPNVTDLQGLAELPLLLRQPGSASRDHLQRAVEKIGVKLCPIMESSDNSSLIKTAREGLGVTVLPVGTVESEPYGKELCELMVEDADLTRTHYVIHRKNRSFDKFKLALTELIINEKRKYKGGAL